jgi:hypothetical protein
MARLSTNLFRAVSASSTLAPVGWLLSRVPLADIVTDANRVGPAPLAQKPAACRIARRRYGWPCAASEPELARVSLATCW